MYMKNRLYRLFFIPLLLVLFWQTALKAGTTTDYEAAELSVVEEDVHGAVYSLPHKIPYLAHHRGEKRANTVFGNSETASENNIEEHAYAGSVPETLRQQFDTAYLLFAKAINLSLSLKKLLFPFHSHL